MVTVTFSRFLEKAPLAGLLLLSLAPGASASTWARTYGGAASYDEVLAAREMTDGTLVVAGVTDSFGTGTGDGWLLRLDADGNALSGQAIGNRIAGGAQCAAIAADGSAVFAGRHVIDPFVIHHGWILRTDAAGNVAWARQFVT